VRDPQQRNSLHSLTRQLLLQQHQDASLSRSPKTLAPRQKEMSIHTHTHAHAHTHTHTTEASRKVEYVDVDSHLTTSIDFKSHLHIQLDCSRLLFPFDVGHFAMPSSPKDEWCGLSLGALE
jgi:hypothetical protein